MRAHAGMRAYMCAYVRVCVCVCVCVRARTRACVYSFGSSYQLITPNTVHTYLHIASLCQLINGLGSVTRVNDLLSKY